jgi:hypothetical protein
VQLELHRTLLAKLLGDLSPARELAGRNIVQMRSSVRGPPAQEWLDEWQRLLDNPGPELVDAFVGTDEHSADLRGVSPFAGLLTEEERTAAIERARSRSRIELGPPAPEASR